MMKNSKIVDFSTYKLKKILYDEEYQQKETLRRKQLLYDYDYKLFQSRISDQINS